MLADKLTGSALHVATLESSETVPAAACDLRTSLARQRPQHAMIIHVYMDVATASHCSGEHDTRSPANADASHPNGRTRLVKDRHAPVTQQTPL